MKYLFYKKSIPLLALFLLLSLVIPSTALAFTNDSLLEENKKEVWKIAEIFVDSDEGEEVAPLDIGTGTYPGTSLTPRAGDVLITNSTSSKGLTGHTGIVVDSDHIVHIAAPGRNPEKITINQWFLLYQNNKILRFNNMTKSLLAGSWANNYSVEYSTAQYSITTNLYSLDPTYCSKIAWHAYYYGANHQLPGTGIITPYSFLSMSDFNTIATLGSW